MKNHVLLNFGIMLFFAGVGSAICTAIHYAFGEPNIIPGTNIPLIMSVPVGLIFFFIAVRFTKICNFYHNLPSHTHIVSPVLVQCQ